MAVLEIIFTMAISHTYTQSSRVEYDAFTSINLPLALSIELTNMNELAHMIP